MSPERPTSRSPSLASKPYTRTSQPEDSEPSIAQSEYPHPPERREVEGEQGFPTKAQYQIIERGYIESLTPRRQGKALISQALFDRIWDVLHNNDSSKENAQFRFWARKMFSLSKSHTVSLGGNGPQPMEQEVLLHDGLLVAVREQIYDLLCYCHASTNHGGRDKTCALIRKHYTWVPKDLVAQFIKACPTCIVKKCGHSDIGLLSPHLKTRSGSPVASISSQLTPEDTSSDAMFREYFHDADGQDDLNSQEPYSVPSTPVDTPHSQFTLNSEFLNGPPEQLNQYDQFSSNNAGSLGGFPMMREVSLYNGLPNGWQYKDINYKDAHAECVEYQRVALIMPYDPSLGRTRPRIPNIVPLFRADFEDMMNTKAEDNESTSTIVQQGSRENGFDSQPLSPTMSSYLQNPTMENDSLPIDPLLLALSASIQSSAEESSPVDVSVMFNDTEITPRRNSETITTTNSLPRLDLESVRTFQDFLTFRDDPNLLSPEEPEINGKDIWESVSGANSPTSSVTSGASGLSLDVASPIDGSGSPDTPSSASPITPIDENGNGQVKVNEKDGDVELQGEENENENEVAKSVDLNINEVIQAVSVCGVRG